MTSRDRFRKSSLPPRPKLSRQRSAPVPRRRGNRPHPPRHREDGEVGCESESESVGPQPAGGVHLRLYGIHKRQLERLDKLREEREAALLNQMTTLTLEQRASQVIPPHHSIPAHPPSAQLFPPPGLTSLLSGGELTQAAALCLRIQQSQATPLARSRRFGGWGIERQRHVAAQLDRGQVRGGRSGGGGGRWELSWAWRVRGEGF